VKAFFTAMTRHPLSLAGMAITTAAAVLFLTFLGLDLLGFHGHPYFGILAYLIVPGIFVLGLALIPFGIRQARKRETRIGAEFPVIDFNRPTIRTRFLIFLALTMLNVVIIAVASYKTVEVMDTTEFCGVSCHSVMAPEYVAYQRGAHASVGCVDCHIGPGAGWFVKSKLSGSWQVVSVNLDLYPRPIPTPVHNLRPARDTCEQCHWPEKFVGDRLKVITTHESDEQNTELKTVLLMRVGGMSGRESQGIHWHVDPANAIRYRSDETRDEIYEVELMTTGGQVERWFAPGADSGDALTSGEWRTMDCVDCHNRPSHTFRSPEQEVDRAIEFGQVARDLPFVRREGLRLLRTDWPDNDAAEAGIRNGLATFYADSYPDVATARAGDIDAAASELFVSWGANVFPGMSVGWGTYPNQIGHESAPGCFRCHDDSHETADGRAISQDCDTCHSLLAMEEVDPEILSTLSP
jgi:nitrate/TMAO reductase-like tetraheme cytochrome c subunit